MLVVAPIIPVTSIIVLPVMSVAPLVLVHWLAMPMEQDVLPAVSVAQVFALMGSVVIQLVLAAPAKDATVIPMPELGPAAILVPP